MINNSRHVSLVHLFLLTLLSVLSVVLSSNCSVVLLPSFDYCHGEVGYPLPQHLWSNTLKTHHGKTGISYYSALAEAHFQELYSFHLSHGLHYYQEDNEDLAEQKCMKQLHKYVCQLQFPYCHQDPSQSDATFHLAPCQATCALVNTYCHLQLKCEKHHIPSGDVEDCIDSPPTPSKAVINWVWQYPLRIGAWIVAIVILYSIISFCMEHNAPRVKIKVDEMGNEYEVESGDDVDDRREREELLREKEREHKQRNRKPTQQVMVDRRTLPAHMQKK